MHKLRGYAAALSFLFASAVSAGTTVMVPTSFEDAPDSNVGNGTCETALPGNPCTLRAAIMESNALIGLNYIQLSGGVYQLTIPGINENGAATGDLDINDDLQILSDAGVLTTIDGGGLDRVFDVLGTTDLTISGLVIRNGRSLDAAAGNDSYLGGGLRLGNNGSNVIQFSIIEDNAANAGGGIWASDSSTLIRYSVLRDNHADGDVQVTNPEGNALRVINGASLRCESCSLYGNSLLGSGSGNRGAVSVHSSGLEMFSSSIDGDSDAGISAYNADVTLGNVTISANGGAGLQWINFAGTGVTLFLRNSIVAGNELDCAVNPQSGATVDMDGHNIDSDGSCALTLPGNGNQSSVQLDWMVGPLNTQIALPARFPWPVGPATDSGSPLDPTSGSPDACFQFDQRGVQRTAGNCDVGAVESVLLFRNGFEGIVI